MTSMTTRKDQARLARLSTQEDYVEAYAITDAEMNALAKLVGGPFMAEYPSLIPVFLKDVRTRH
ncbi:hypothetical protein ACCS79_03485 [Rhizobium johnstonii]|uniref:hypothetical protein n=1 Tax=Rhizobium johnstonii TaxID=3019933 RepID=UPI003F97B9BF